MSTTDRQFKRDADAQHGTAEMPLFKWHGLIRDARGISANEKLTLTGIVWHAQKTGFAHPSIGKLGEETGLSRSTLQRAISSLEEAGVIEIIRRTRKGDKGQTSNGYVLNAWRLASMTEKASVNESERCPGSITETQGGHTSEQGPESSWGGAGVCVMHQEAVHRSSSKEAVKGKQLGGKQATPTPPPPPPPPDQDLQVIAEQIKDEWNRVAAKTDLPAVLEITPRQRSLITQALSDSRLFEKLWYVAIQAIQFCPFLIGLESWDEKPFYASLDWLFKESNWLRVVQGEWIEEDKRAKLAEYVRGITQEV